MEYAEFIKISQYCKQNWSEQCNSAICSADRVCENRFLFDSPWDLERTENEVSFGDKIDWCYKLGGDEEFLFQLNRHGFLIQLGQAYYLTNDEKYLKHFCRIIENWIDTQPCDYKKNGPWRSLETGIRADNWIKAIKYIQNTKYYSQSLKTKFEKSLLSHIDVLKKEHSAFQKGSNWGIIQDGGLFQIGLYFYDNNIIELALERLNQETDLQIMSDGVHWEQSSGYHNAVLTVLLDVIISAQKQNISLPDSLKNKIFSMAQANIKWIKPNGHHPLFGDSDDNDIRDIMSTCAYIFDRSDFKYCGYNILSYDSIWNIGFDSIEKYDKICSQAPTFLNAILKDSGNFILRENQSENSNWLCFHNGYTGGGHAHADKLHFDLMIKGKDVLVDAGRYTYLNNTERRYLKSSKAHNVCLIDNKQYLQMTNQWGVKNPAPNVNYPYFDNEYCSLIGGGHFGYLKSKGSYIERQILYIKPDIYIIIDRFKSRLFHTYQQYFHFSPSSSVKINNNCAEFNDETACAKMHFFSPNIKLKKEDSLYSSNYNAICSNPAIKTSFKSFGTTCAITVIYGNKKEDFKPFTVLQLGAKRASDGKDLSTSVADGIIIKTPEKEYTVCLAHKELKKPFVCNEKIAAGTINVFCNNKMIFKKW